MGGTVFKCICGYENWPNIIIFTWISYRKSKCIISSMTYVIVWSLWGLVKLKREICRNFEKQQIYTFFLHKLLCYCSIFSINIGKCWYSLALHLLLIL